MSVIMSRALPEIDGFKLSHRKLLYTMCKMNLLKGDRTKSANVVGQTMKLNCMAIWRFTKLWLDSQGAIIRFLHPLIDSKGNFGNISVRDMSFAVQLDIQR